MTIDTVLVVVGGALLIFGLASRVVERLWLSPVLVSLILGIVLGPRGVSLLDAEAAGIGISELGDLTRIALALGLMSIGLQVTISDVRRSLRAVVGLLAIGMPGMWVATGLGAALALELPMWTALLLGAVLTPTDPVVAASLVEGRIAEEDLPQDLRRTLQLESGANDGLALPLVLLPAMVLAHGTAGAIGPWALESLREVGVGVVSGLAVGFGIGKLTVLDVRYKETSSSALFGVGAALALLTLGAVHLLGGSGILAAFVCGLAFSATLGSKVRDQLEQVQETMVLVAIVPTFLLFGAMLPWEAWTELGWPGLVFAGWVLVVRRPPVVPLALLPARSDLRSTAWLAWFGPLGVAAIYYATAVEELEAAAGRGIFDAASLAITASVVAHAVTATPLSRLYAGRSPWMTLLHPLRRGIERSR